MDVERIPPVCRALVAHVRAEDACVCHVLEVRRLDATGAVVDLGGARPVWATVGRLVEVALFEAAPREGFGLAMRARVTRVVESMESHEVAFALDARHPAMRRFLEHLTEQVPCPPPLPSRPKSGPVVLRPPLPRRAEGGGA
ncbi:MAG: hypothetical protein KC619_34400 [Myxococcales bacterium]|nr:hypothetical protein [Myxococcales bacterium]